MTKLLGISGSLRADSTNTRLVKAAAAIHGGDLTMGDIRFPLYDGDLEAESGVPEEVQTLADQIAAADAVIVSTPEYNKMLSGVLKNALDWVSRADGNPWRHKPVAVMSAAAGRAGGERGQWTLRLALLPFRPVIVPGPEVMIASSSKAFDDDGGLADEFGRKLVMELMEELKTITAMSRAG
ncbi:MAG: NADPH-dependent FMN reductase [Shimia sp.]